ncbi:MAG: cupredoxin domain-containing protein [Candidatus Moraniibacteriota bacterium]
MKKVLYIIIPLLVLGLMEGVSWMVLKNNPSQLPPSTDQRSQQESAPVIPEQPLPLVIPTEPLPEKTGSDDSEAFPPPSTETVNGRGERTIHVGVRQYAWDPSTITAKQGELVRLIIHNADVQHGLAIPELGVNQDIPPEGAVIEFVASKAGSFEFFCSIWCGEGHMEMRGKLIVE